MSVVRPDLLRLELILETNQPHLKITTPFPETTRSAQTRLDKAIRTTEYLTRPESSTKLMSLDSKQRGSEKS